jgi:hypothetical protein
MAIGILVVLSGVGFKLSQNLAISGNNQPEKIPINIARKIHNVKYLSKNDKRLVTITFAV